MHATQGPTKIPMGPLDPTKQTGPVQNAMGPRTLGVGPLVLGPTVPGPNLKLNPQKYLLPNLKARMENK